MIKAIIQSSLAEKTSMIKGYLKRKEYYPEHKVEANVKDLMHCMLCPNMCRFDCPAVQASKIDTHSPATKARIAYYLEMNRLEKIEENIMPLFEGCVHCSACKMWCPFDFAVGDLLEGVAEDLYKVNALPSDLKTFTKRIQSNNGLYPAEKINLSKSLLKKLETGDIYYFPGCVTIGNNSKVIESVVEIAEKAGVSLKTDLSQQWCCGAPTMYSGDKEKAKELAKHNKKLFEESKVEAIICECPECAYTLRDQYLELDAKIKIPIYHVSEWIAQLLSDGKIKLKNGDKLKQFSKMFPISYHDPCVLTRKMGITDEPYEILQQIFPENFKEATYSKELTHCCGFGGLVNVVNQELANKMSANRLEEFVRDGIKTIVTSCPTCWYSFMKNNPEMQFEIIDLVELVAEMIDEK